MDLKEKLKKLAEIYRRYEIAAKPYKEEALCRPGCAFCCTHYGNVDITTLEGLAIVRHLRNIPKKSRRTLEKKVRKNKTDKEAGKAPTCPFLKPDKTCAIYEARPFSCRSLYSVGKCEGAGPSIHRQAAELAGQTVLTLQALDSSGYSGHLSYILYLLDLPDFYRMYTSGGFNPSLIADFGKAHGLAINFAKISNHEMKGDRP